MSRDPWAHVKLPRVPSSRARAFGDGRHMPHPIDEVAIWRFLFRLVMWPVIIVGVVLLWVLMP